MNKRLPIKGKLVIIMMVLMLLIGAADAKAFIDGLTGTTFNLTSKAGTISTADGNSILIWGYANGAGPAQFPGPTLVVNQGATITINLTNQLSVPVSIVFPGQSVTATGGQAGILTNEALSVDNPSTPVNEALVTYTFTATKPGTYTYYSGTRPDLQVEMGLQGAIIVRPTGYNPANSATYTAYGHPDSEYRREVLMFLSEMDPAIHALVDAGQLASVDSTTFRPQYWFINGRTGPDTMDMPDVPWLPSQPYNCMPMMHPGEKVLIRFIGGGRDLHPLHTHGNHVRIIAKDGRFGETIDGIFQWTGEKLGWDIYGHAPGDPLEPNEYAPDHGKPVPTTVPNPIDVFPSTMYSGSPYLGTVGFLPPGGAGQLNLTGAYFFMWHSHNEDEIVNFNIFPGGMMTMSMVEHPMMPIMPDLSSN
jgi:FtsP/CotA-like multicopper oxidase with cupredoxin domain